MFVSIITGSTPLGNEAWGLSNRMTASALDAIGKNGGPRCCKRDAYVSLETAVDYVRERFGVRLEKDDIRCEFHQQNAQCLGERCPFYPNH